MVRPLHSRNRWLARHDLRPPIAPVPRHQTVHNLTLRSNTLLSLAVTLPAPHNKTAMSLENLLPLGALGSARVVHASTNLAQSLLTSVSDHKYGLL
jgi:hypothetical protein